MDVSISPAERQDISTLAAINIEAYPYETTAQIAYDSWPDVNNIVFFEERLADRWDRPGCSVYKATDRSSGEILGFVCWTLEEVKDPDKPNVPTPTSKILMKSVEGRNMEFVKAMGGTVETLLAHMKNERHYYLSTFAVRRKAQNKGIGSLLLTYCLSFADRDSLPSWLIAFPGSHDLYVRDRFRDIDHRDVDLCEYDKCKFRGYGVYRSYAMRRDPATPVSSGGWQSETQVVEMGRFGHPLWRSDGP